MCAKVINVVYIVTNRIPTPMPQVVKTPLPQGFTWCRNFIFYKVKIIVDTEDIVLYNRKAHNILYNLTARIGYASKGRNGVLYKELNKRKTKFDLRR